MSENKEAAKAVTKARIKLLLDNPFLGTLALRAKLVEVPKGDPRGPAATDGTSLYYEAETWLQWSPEERIGVMAHEVAHNALLHSYRLKARDHKKFNRAADYAINDLLVNTYNYKLPAGTLLDKQYYEMTAEAIYNELPDDPDDQNPAPNWGGVLPAPGTAAEQAANQQGAEQAIRAAAMVAKQAGKLPGNLARILEFLEPKINWKQALREFLVARFARDDYKWYPPNMQYLHMGLHVPTLGGESFGPVVICIDTSGSIGEKELNQFMGEVSGILEDCRPEKAIVIYCDAEINRVDEFTVEDLPIKPVICGGGGTDFRPPFEYLTEKGIEPECLIYLTDMYGAFPQVSPHYPTVWARTSRVPAPWGTAIDLDFD